MPGTRILQHQNDEARAGRESSEIRQFHCSEEQSYVYRMETTDPKSQSKSVRRRMRAQISGLLGTITQPLSVDNSPSLFEPESVSHSVVSDSL